MRPLPSTNSSAPTPSENWRSASSPPARTSRTSRDNLLNRWPRFIDNPPGYRAVCAEVQRLVEDDLCYAVIESFRRRWRELPERQVEWYTVRDVVQQMEAHGHIAAASAILWYTSEHENAIATGDDRPWRAAKLAIYREALATLREATGVPHPAQADPAPTS